MLSSARAVRDRIGVTDWVGFCCSRKWKQKCLKHESGTSGGHTPVSRLPGVNRWTDPVGTFPFHAVLPEMGRRPRVSRPDRIGSSPAPGATNSQTPLRPPPRLQPKQDTIHDHSHPFTSQYQFSLAHPRARLEQDPPPPKRQALLEWLEPAQAPEAAKASAPDAQGQAEGGHGAQVLLAERGARARLVWRIALVSRFGRG